MTQQPEPSASESPDLPEGAGLIISPPPRPRKTQLPDDVFEQYNQSMRQKAADLYRRMQQDPVPIAPGLPDVVNWMRSKGVRIKAKMTTEGTFYELEQAPPA